MATRCCIDRCNQPLECNHQAIASHLQTYHYHGASFDNVSVDYQCRWSGCNKSVPARSLVSHIMAAHVRS